VDEGVTTPFNVKDELTKLLADSPGGLQPFRLPDGQIVEVSDGELFLPSEQAVRIPWVDPVPVFVAATTGGTSLALRGGASLLPAIGRGLTSGTVGVVADFPIGVATEQLGGDNETLATLLNLTIGLVSAGTVEALVEKQIVKAASKTRH